MKPKTYTDTSECTNAKIQMPETKPLRIMGQLRWEGTSGDCLVQGPCSKLGQLEQAAQGHG